MNSSRRMKTLMIAVACILFPWNISAQSPPLPPARAYGRDQVVSKTGIVATTQVLASQVGRSYTAESLHMDPDLLDQAAEEGRGSVRDRLEAAAKAEQKHREEEAAAKAEQKRREEEAAAAKVERERQEQKAAAAAKFERERHERKATAKVRQERQEQEVAAAWRAAAAKAERERQEQEVAATKAEWDRSHVPPQYASAPVPSPAASTQSGTASAGRTKETKQCVWTWVALTLLFVIANFLAGLVGRWQVALVSEYFTWNDMSLTVRMIVSSILSGIALGNLSLLLHHQGTRALLLFWPGYLIGFGFFNSVSARDQPSIWLGIGCVVAFLAASFYLRGGSPDFPWKVAALA